MRKFFNFVVVLLVLFITSSCGKNEKIYSMILPSGTPSIALADFLYNNEEVSYDIVSGSDLLVSAFTQGNYDIIVAPVNLGAKLSSSNSEFKYSLYKPIVGCNYYILSNTYNNFSVLDKVDISAFGKNSTPGVMLSTLCAYYEINPNVTYADSVTDVNPLLVSGKANTILTAEPSKTVISNGKNYNVIDLAKLWKDMSNNDYDVPQAGIFVKNDLDVKDLNQLLDSIEASIKNVLDNPSAAASKIIEIDSNLSKMDQNLLKEAIPNCNILTKPLNKEEVEYYFQKVIDLGLGATVGGKLPDESFYY